MNVIKLNEILSGDTDKIIQVLESMGYDEIRERKGQKGSYLAFPNLDGDNKTACNIYVDSLNYNNYTRNKRGNIYTLIMDTLDINFPKSLEYVAKVLNINKNDIDKKIQYPFGGFYKKIIREIEEPEMTMKTYDISVLEEYKNQYSQLFFEDGIDFISQSRFNIGYDIWSNRITIPEFTLDGKLCGIMGRLNDKNCAHEDRWLPIIPCSRDLTLFGYTDNYKKIKEKDLVIIGESEKFPMQLNSMHCEIGLATCGHFISTVQAKYIKGLQTSRIVLAYDEGQDEDFIRAQAEKLLLRNHFLSNKVGYIFDKDNEILKKGSKDSPSDCSKKDFLNLIKNHIVWL